MRNQIELSEFEAKLAETSQVDVISITATYGSIGEPRAKARLERRLYPEPASSFYV